MARESGTGPRHDPSAESASGGEQDGPGGNFYSRWERAWAWTERWIPHALLVLSTVASITTPGQGGLAPSATVALAALAGAWVTLGFTFAPAGRRERPAYALAYMAGLLTLAALLMARDPVFFLFGIVGFLHASILRPRYLVFVGTGVTSFLVLAMTWEGGFPQPTPGGNAAFLSLFVLQTVLIGVGTVGGEALRGITEERRQAMHRLERALVENEALQAQLVNQAREAGVVDERRRLAREIHDTLAQGLIGIITQLEAADRARRHDPEMLGRRMEVATRLARENLEEARRSVQALRPRALEHDQLLEALTGVADAWSQQAGVDVRLAVDDLDDARLPTCVEVALVRIAQEALANVAKHARAATVVVTVTSMPDAVVLDVRDDGRGFEPHAVDAGERRGFGLHSMHQRVSELGGALAVESRPGSGTAISASLPAHPFEESHA